MRVLCTNMMYTVYTRNIPIPFPIHVNTVPYLLPFLFVLSVVCFCQYTDLSNMYRYINHRLPCFDSFFFPLRHKKLDKTNVH